MKEDRKAQRRRDIHAAAYEVLLERGFAKTSMLEVAKRANASNETLYRWYGDKYGLLAAMVQENAGAGLAALSAPLADDGPVGERLQTFGALLLQGVLSDRAIAVNRAAAADTDGMIGEILAKHGREAVVPVLEAFFRDRAIGVSQAPPGESVEIFLALLLGDLQIRRVTGRLAAPDAADCQRRARQATELFLTLCH